MFSFSVGGGVAATTLLSSSLSESESEKLIFVSLVLVFEQKGRLMASKMEDLSEGWAE